MLEFSTEISLKRTQPAPPKITSGDVDSLLVEVVRALAKFKKLFPKVEEGPVLKDLVWMTSWEFCLINSAGLGFGKRIKHISLMAIIHS